jgi:hypothetical protein
MSEASLHRAAWRRFFDLLIAPSSQGLELSQTRGDTVFARCQLGPLSLRVRPSIGIAFYPQDGTTFVAGNKRSYSFFTTA